MKLMDSLKPYLSLIIAALLAANLFSTWSLNRTIEEKMDKLLTSQNNIQSAVEENQSQISSLSSNMQDELERQASLFSESNSVVSYSAEGLVVTTTLTPKEYNTDSKITVTCSSNGKSFAKEAVQNGSEFEAVCVVPYCETIDISAAITTGEAIEQEPLPSIPCQTVLAFDIYTEYSYSENLLYFTISNPQSGALLESLDGIHLAILREGTVIGHVYPKSIESSSLPDSMKGSSICLAYTADLSQFINLEGDMQVVPKIQSSTGLGYAEDAMFQFSGTANGLDSYVTGNSWYPPVFHQ
ncbi:MAG: hypothetical protein IJ411_05355 [Oscillospiraceae bacterium]|nr:hypothetical protein [Oscillospiraceae bacterium]